MVVWRRSNLNHYIRMNSIWHEQEEEKQFLSALMTVKELFCICTRIFCVCWQPQLRNLIYCTAVLFALGDSGLMKLTNFAFTCCSVALLPYWMGKYVAYLPSWWLGDKITIIWIPENISLLSNNMLTCKCSDFISVNWRSTRGVISSSGTCEAGALT